MFEHVRLKSSATHVVLKDPPLGSHILWRVAPKFPPNNHGTFTFGQCRLCSAVEHARSVGGGQLVPGLGCSSQPSQRWAGAPGRVILWDSTPAWSL